MKKANMAEAYHALKEGKTVCRDGLEYKIILDQLHYRSPFDHRKFGSDSWIESANTHWYSNDWEIKEDEKEIEERHLATITEALQYVFIWRRDNRLPDAIHWLLEKFKK